MTIEERADIHYKLRSELFDEKSFKEGFTRGAVQYIDWACEWLRENMKQSSIGCVIDKYEQELRTYLEDK